MKQFLLIGIFTVLSLTGMQAQTSNKTEDVKVSEPITELSTDGKTTNIDVAAKKKDILTNKIETKLNGKINLFIVKEPRLIC